MYNKQKKKNKWIKAVLITSPYFDGGMQIKRRGDRELNRREEATWHRL